MTEALHLLFWGVGGVIAYAYLANRMMWAGHPLRVRAGKLALDLLHGDDLTDRQRAILAGCTCGLMDRWRPWLTALFVPIAILRLMILGRRRTRGPSGKATRRYHAALALGILGNLLCSPLAFLITTLWALIAVLLFLPLGYVRNILEMLATLGHGHGDHGHTTA